jgi:hypothetical protein
VTVLTVLIVGSPYYIDSPLGVQDPLGTGNATSGPADGLDRELHAILFCARNERGEFQVKDRVCLILVVCYSKIARRSGSLQILRSNLPLFFALTRFFGDQPRWLSTQDSHVAPS